MIPNEVHRARGTKPDRRTNKADGSKESRLEASAHGGLLPEEEVQPLPSVLDTGPPDPPDSLSETGKELWDQIWDPASRIIWISPGSDYRAVEHACACYEAFVAVHQAYMNALTVGDDIRSTYQAWAAASKAFGDALNDIGLNPMSRSRLGVAEVRETLSKMDKLAQQYGKRKPKSVGADSE